MSLFRQLAHLQEQLGEERFAALIDSGNTGKVKVFCDTLIVAPALPTGMTVGGRTYEILGFLQGDEESVGGDTMVARAVEAKADLGKDDGEHILAHQDEIPVTLRGKVVFVFPGWRRPGDSRVVAYLYWGDDSWDQFWHWLDFDCYGLYRVLRRK